MKTTLLKQAQIKPKWRIVDAKGKVLGRVASEVAGILIGKDKPYFTPNILCGGGVIVINAKEIRLTGKKLEQKIRFTHSRYLGGDKYTPYKKIMTTMPEKAILWAVRGMLPKNKLGDKMLTHLRVYPGAEHPHAAQLKGE